jgi:hypothetical protein
MYGINNTFHLAATGPKIFIIFIILNIF